MTVSAVVRKAGPTPGNGVATVFPFAFKVFADSDISVVRTVIASGAQTTLVLNDPLGYTVARNPDQNSTPGGSITYNPLGVPMPATQSLTAISVVPLVQGTHITNGGAFFANNIEDAIDKAVVNVQDLAAKVNSAVQFPAVDSAALNAILPAAALRANTTLGFDALGNVLVGSVTGSLVSAAMLPVVQAVTIALGRVALGYNVQMLWAGVAGGTANALTLTPAPALEVYSPGQMLFFKSGAAPNSAATTLAVSGQGAVAMQSNAAACVGGEIEASRYYAAMYDGAAFQFMPIAPSLLLSLFTTKGDIILGTAAGKVARKAAGAEGSFLQTDPAQTDGMVYVKLGAGDRRQCVLSAVLDTNGYNNVLSAGAALNFNVDANPSPMVVTYAAGFGGQGALDLVSVVIADAANQGALAASNTNFIYSDWASLSTVTWSSGLIPPQYGYAFDRTQGSLMNFDGINGATTTTDDFGNTWTFAGNAQLDTATKKFGASSLKLDGVGDGVSSANFTTFGDGSWEVSFWFNITALPGVGLFSVLISAFNAGGFGLQLYLRNQAGVTKLALNASSNGTSTDIAATVAGANTVWTLAQQNKARIVFDALSGNYKVFLSLNGAAETTDVTVATASKICAISTISLGLDFGGGNGFNGYLDAFRFIRAVPNTSTEVPAAVAPAITDHKVNFFSIPDMKMYEVTAASGVAGVNPTLTARNRVCHGEQDTSGAAVTATRNYAIRGDYFGEQQAPLVAATAYSFNDNIGTKFKAIDSWIECVTAESGWKVGERQLTISDGNAGTGAVLAGQTVDTASRNISRLFTHLNLMAADYSNGNTQFSPALAKWKAGVRIRRTF